MRGLINSILRFKRDEDGAPTVEFVIIFPFFMSLFLMGFESGYYLVRNVMLERALDISVRNVRLGNGKVPQLAAFKENICMNMVILPDCHQALQVEMVALKIEPGQVGTLSGAISCIDRRHEDIDQSSHLDYDVGSINQLVVVRACVATSPMFPTTGLGAGLKRTDSLGDNYAIVATSAFVTEPGTRAKDPYVPGAPVGTATPCDPADTSCNSTGGDSSTGGTNG